MKLTSALPETPEEARELSEIDDLLERIAALGALDLKRDRLVERTKQLTSDGRAVLIFTGDPDTMLTCATPWSVRLVHQLPPIREKEERFGQRTAGYLRRRSWSQRRFEKGPSKFWFARTLRARGLTSKLRGPSSISTCLGTHRKSNNGSAELTVLGKSCLCFLSSIFISSIAWMSVCIGLWPHAVGFLRPLLGPMQPVLSHALRMLIGHEEVDEEALVRAADEIRANPTIMQAFPEDEPIPLSPEPALISVSDTEALLAALDGTGVQVTAESNALHTIGTVPSAL